MSAPIKLLERIRALLAMGGDASSPNEAAIALKRARKLMDEHQIRAIDLQSLQDSDMGEGSVATTSSRQQRWINNIAVALAEMNDCIVSFTRNTHGNQLIYEIKGFKEDAQVCEFMLTYIIEQGILSYKQDKEKFALCGLKDKNDYLKGYSYKICRRIHMLINDRKQELDSCSDSRSLVLAKASTVSAYYGEQRVSTVDKTGSNYSANAFAAGSKAGNKAHLGAVLSTTATDTPAIKNKR